MFYHYLIYFYRIAALKSVNKWESESCIPGTYRGFFARLTFDPSLIGPQENQLGIRRRRIPAVASISVIPR